MVTIFLRMNPQLIALYMRESKDYLPVIFSVLIHITRVCLLVLAVASVHANRHMQYSGYDSSMRFKLVTASIVVGRQAQVGGSCPKQPAISDLWRGCSDIRTPEKSSTEVYPY